METAEPQKIILFGSTARGDARPDSDLDFLIVKRGAQQRHLAAQVYEGLRGVRVAVDVIVASPEDLGAVWGQPRPRVQARSQGRNGAL